MAPIFEPVSDEAQSDATKISLTDYKTMVVKASDLAERHLRTCRNSGIGRFPEILSCGLAFLALCYAGKFSPTEHLELLMRIERGEL